MSTTKVAKKLPKRVTNTKRQERRAKSWLKNKEAKDLRIASQKRREQYNKLVHCTGKMRYSNSKHSVDCFEHAHVPQSYSAAK